jgi:hypothetical protein
VVPASDSETPVAGSEQPRRETVIDPGLVYRPGEPVHVRVVRRDRRISITDNGAAIEKADRPPAWRLAAQRVRERLDVNISRAGVVSLPVVRVGPGEQKIVNRIAEASLDFYRELLESEQ